VSRRDKAGMARHEIDYWLIDISIGWGITVMPLYLDMTNVALMLKVKNPSSVTEFISVSLCNILYKLSLKVLAHRLMKILSLIISHT
jgi:hypothetical protein